MSLWQQAARQRAGLSRALCRNRPFQQPCRALSFSIDRYMTNCGLHVDRTLPPTFNKILIANRGEIACRVMRTARELQVKTVAVYSEVDAHAQHVQMADEAYCIGPAASKESYLRGDHILDVASRSGAQAIHPGYGFLSENAGFAKQCAEAGVTFIGPPAKAIEAMGSKSASKNIMTSSGVPVVPGYHGEDQSIETLTKEAEKIGFPVMIKAVLGGGGKGMRICFKKEEFQNDLASCIREAETSFGDSRVLLERYITRPRHVEFQVFGDSHGDAIHLFERDCSVQRRHQKVFEESPAPGMSQELRNRMGESAVDAAKAVGYVGAGTVEFIVDAETEDYFFMEMNTRLQVEHPVTEMVCGRDLVQLQLHVAAGHPLPFKQSEANAFVGHVANDGAAPQGHSIEARIYAENPEAGFLPCTGTLLHHNPPQNVTGGLVRVETGVRSNDEVSIYYDPMISKLVVWAADRPRALSAMNDALANYEVIGLPTNIPFLQRIATHPAFIKGRVETGFIPTYEDELLPKTREVPNEAVGLAVLYLLNKQEAGQDAWEAPGARGFRLNGSNKSNISLVLPSFSDDTQEVQVDAEVTVDGDVVHVKTETAQFTVSARNAVRKDTETSAQCHSSIDGKALKGRVVQIGKAISIYTGGKQYALEIPSFAYGGNADVKGCLSPMPGMIVKTMVSVGDTVEEGQPLMIMWGMKMEHTIKAPEAGVISKIFFAENDFVDGGKLLVAFEEE